MQYIMIVQSLHHVILVLLQISLSYSDAFYGEIYMKKKAIVGIIILLIFVAIVGTKLYIENQETKAACDLFLEWFYDVEAEEIAEWQIYDMRKGWLPDEVVRIELADEQKEEFCQMMKNVSSDEVILGAGCDKREFVDLRLFTTEEEEWFLRFADDVIYVQGVPNELNELYGWWSWEIKDDELIRFITEYLE